MMNLIVRSQRGFTLLEIMIVVVILGILAAIVSQNIMDKPDEARITATKATLNTIDGALTLYKADTFRLPTTEQGLEALITKPANLSSGAQWKGPYLKGKLPKDAWSNEFKYLSPGAQGRPYDLYSLGADAVEGGEGSAADISVWDLH